MRHKGVVGVVEAQLQRIFPEDDPTEDTREQSEKRANSGRSEMGITLGEVAQEPNSGRNK